MLFTGLGNSPYRRWANKVTIPWQSLSRFVYPRTIEEMMAWAEELWLHHGLYSQAIKKAVRYFMTEVEIYGEDINYKDRKKYAEVIADNYDILEEAATVGDDFIAMGISFTSLYIPFERNLQCPSCGGMAPMLKMFEDGDAKWDSLSFRGVCPFPNCRRSVDYTVADRQLPDEQLKPRIVRWPPQYMQIKDHPLSGRKKYRVDVTRYPELNDGLMRGDPLFLSDTPWEFIQATKNRRPLEFGDDQIYQMKMPSLAVTEPGLRGWGLPLFMNEFETALLIIMLDKYTEAIAVDYLVPFRVISPPKLQGQEDPLISVDMGGFMAHVRRMIDEHRNNPTTFHTAPMPLEYQTLGGEASQLVPVDLLDHFEKRLLHSMGIPEEFQSSHFQTQGPLIAFTMFERQWQFFANSLNKWLTWLSNRQGELTNWESVKARLLPISIYEDPETRQVKLEGAAARKISNRTAYRSFGIDYDYEQDQIIEEDKAEIDRQREFAKEMENEDINMQALATPPAGQEMLMQEEMAAQGAGGAAPMAGAAPMPMAGAAPMPMGAPAAPGNVSMDELLANAQQIAQQLLTMDPTLRRSQLIELKKTDETLHAQVKQILEDLEQQAKTVGVQQARAGQIPSA
jgi:hypothetical protein